jgi:inner membrane protein
MVVDFVRSLGPWAWIIVGLILLGLEVLAPGNVFVWFGVAALITGGLALITALGWQAYFLIFVVLAVVLVVAGRRYFARGPSVSEQPFLNQRAAGLVGRSYVLTEPIVDGHGQVRIDDTKWRVVGPDLPAGTKVRVVSVDGVVLAVAADSAS